MKNTALRWLYAVPGRKKHYIVYLTLLHALQGGSGVLYALLLRNIVDAAAGGDSHGFRLYAAGIIVLAASQLALGAIIRFLTALSRSTLENIFKGRLVDTLLHKDYLSVVAVHSGQWLNQLTSDTRIVADSYVDIFPNLVGRVVKLISAFVMMTALDPRFAAIMIPCGILMFLFSIPFRKNLKQLHKGIQEANGRLRVFLQEHIGSLLIIRAFVVEDKTRLDAGKKMDDHKAARMRYTCFYNFYNIGLGLASRGISLMGVIWCGYGILKGSISFGTLTAITQLIPQIRAPFSNISGALPKYYSMLASAERLMEAEALPEDTCKVKPYREVLDLYQNNMLAFGLRDVSFSYNLFTEEVGEPSKNNQPEVLRDFSLEIQRGEYVAFTGQSGCGKSTVLKLMMCIYQPDRGLCYCVDEKDRIRELSSADRRLFAYVPQGNVLMHGSIRETVSFAAPEAAWDEVRLSNALRIACAEDFVTELDLGVDTLLGERGAGLSEGQMQRLAIARAVFSGSPILLLDEATSALDADTEKQLLHNLRSMTDKTVLIVTHRPEVLTICDRVLHFTENGVREKSDNLQEMCGK